MNMSFMKTEPQVLSQDKDVTRRKNWRHLRVGQRIQPIRKGMGLKEGEKVELLGCPVIIVGVRRERLNKMILEPEYGKSEARREGFPHLDGAGFVKFFCEELGCKPGDYITRIQFKYETRLRTER